MHIFGAERGLLATPTKCGTYTVESEFVPWAAEVLPVVSTDSFAIDTGPADRPAQARRDHSARRWSPVRPTTRPAPTPRWRSGSTARTATRT